MNLVIGTLAFENERFIGPPATEPVLEDVFLRAADAGSDAESKGAVRCARGLISRPFRREPFRDGEGVQSCRGGHF
jgi:hypothetical protein